MPVFTLRYVRTHQTGSRIRSKITQNMFSPFPLHWGVLVLIFIARDRVGFDRPFPSSTRDLPGELCGNFKFSTRGQDFVTQMHASQIDYGGSQWQAKISRVRGEIRIDGPQTNNEHPGLWVGMIPMYAKQRTYRCRRWMLYQTQIRADLQSVFRPREEKRG